MPNTTEHVTTAEQLAALPEDGKRYELVNGVLQMMSPAGGQHGGIAATLLFHITSHVRQYGLGKTYAADGAVWMNGTGLFWVSDIGSPRLSLLRNVDLPCKNPSEARNARAIVNRIASTESQKGLEGYSYRSTTSLAFPRPLVEVN